MRLSSLKKIAILTAILAVPAFLYYFLQEKGKNRYQPLNIFGPKSVATSFHVKRGKRIPDTIYHAVKDFKLLNQEGRFISLDVKDRLTVVNFFYTRCPLLCSLGNKEMARVAKRFEKNKRLQFFSITVDPHFDTPSAH